ncbi:MAG: protease modulator HflC [Verrucomicrobia bacterium]|nr:protease modulator HflC [Kiritimatiellia bacterium]MCP5487411.1 protease modulator HflC [Verrucomicrobiota bacterium]
MNKALSMLGVAAILLAIPLFQALYTVPETEQVLITQFGRPVGDPVTEAGLHFKIPFIQKVNRIEKRILEWDGRPNDMPTKDKLYISVDTFGRWRIRDPLTYFLRLRDERSAQSRLEDILGSETRSAVAKHELIEIIRSTEDRVPLRDDALIEANLSVGKLLPIRKGRKIIEEEIRLAAAEKLKEFGIELLDVRFKRINYNDSVRRKIYERMISERQQIAERFRSEGAGEAAKIIGKKERELRQIESIAYREVQTIRGKADAEATEIYASAYNQNPEAVALYEFTKSLETYESILDNQTTLLLSTDSDLFHFLKSMDGKRE